MTLVLIPKQAFATDNNSNLPPELKSPQQETSQEQIASLLESKMTAHQKNSDILLETQKEIEINNPYVTNELPYKKHDNYDNHHHGKPSTFEQAILTWNVKPSFNIWLNRFNNRKHSKDYYNFLVKNVGIKSVPPMSQMLLTSRSWFQCGLGASEYEVPPRYLWRNILPTLRLLNQLKRRRVIPADTIIRSVYRNPYLNRCSKGASNSKHVLNSAIDLWSPSFIRDSWKKNLTKNNLCMFWRQEGKKYNFGLGLYRTGSIHIDTQGYRQWGRNHSEKSSPCRHKGSLP